MTIPKLASEAAAAVAQPSNVSGFTVTTCLQRGFH